MKIVKIVEVKALHILGAMTMVVVMFMLGAVYGYDYPADFQVINQAKAGQIYEDKFYWVIDGQTFSSDQGFEIEKESSGFALESDIITIQTNVYAWYDAYYYGSGRQYVRGILEYEDLFVQISEDFGIDPIIPLGIGALESNGDPNKVSRVGAKGLMQIYKIPNSCRLKALNYVGNPDQKFYQEKLNIAKGILTLQAYTKEKNNNLFLGLCSYVWGPNNEQLLNAQDFASVRGSIKNTDARYYPTKAMALALMTKVYKQEGRFVPYKLHCKKNDYQCKQKELENQQLIESVELAGLNY